jgi:hypothetical protein
MAEINETSSKCEIFDILNLVDNWNPKNHSYLLDIIVIQSNEYILSHLFQNNWLRVKKVKFGQFG